MEYKNEEEKIKEWHRQAEIGRQEALRREKIITYGVITFISFVSLLIVAMFGLIGLFIAESIELINS
jgi:hypothetical protein